MRTVARQLWCGGKLPGNMVRPSKRAVDKARGHLGVEEQVGARVCDDVGLRGTQMPITHGSMRANLEGTLCSGTCVWNKRTHVL